MVIEQPNFNTQNIEEEKKKRSNVIRGPWEARTPEGADKSPAAPARENAERKNNVIEGPWPKGNPESWPENPKVKESEKAPLPQTPEEREAAVEKIRQELLELSEKNEERSRGEQGKEPEPREKDGDEDEKARIPFHSGMEKYKPCEVCGGSGRRYWIMTCPACKGFGSVVAKSSSESGEYVVSRDGSMTKT